MRDAVHSSTLFLEQPHNLRNSSLFIVSTVIANGSLLVQQLLYSYSLKCINGLVCIVSITLMIEVANSCQKLSLLVCL